MYENLVFSGGGINCLCYIGVLQYIEEHLLRQHLKRAIGSSGGSLFLLTLILDYSFHDILHILLGLDITLIRDITTESVFSFFETYGLDTGNKLEHLIKLLILKKVDKADITFEELYKIIPIEFTVTGFCLNTQETEYFNYHTSPDMPVYLAVRISCSIPFIYNVVRYQNKSYIDGGMMDNYPIDFFASDINKTIGFCIHTNSDPRSINGLDDFVYNIMTSITIKMQKLNIQKYASHSVLIHSEIPLTKFDLSDNIKKKCVQNGYKKACEYFDAQIIEDILDSIITRVIEQHHSEECECCPNCNFCQFQVKNVKSTNCQDCCFEHTTMICDNDV